MRDESFLFPIVSVTDGYLLPPMIPLSLFRPLAKTSFSLA